jgi:hypothetical protein
MRSPLLPALLAGLGLVWLSGSPAPAAKPPGAAEIRKLIEQLGSGSFTEREEATAALDAAGEPALAGLRKAVDSDDAEVRRRASELLKKIEHRVDAEHLMAPTKVSLSFKDTPVAEAVAELAKKAGGKVVLQDPAGKLRDRKVTLEAGEVTFWEALDRLSAAAGLAEEEVPFAPTGPSAAVMIAVPAAPGALPPAPILSKRPLIRGGPMTVIGQLTLADGRPAAGATARAGALRVRATRAPREGDDGLHVCLNLTVTAESNVRCQDLFIARIDKAVDDQGQELEPAAEAAFGRRNQLVTQPGFLVQQIPVRLTPGEKPSKSLRELHGTLSGRLLTDPRPVLAVDDVLKSAGKSVRGKEGGELKVLEVSRDASGEVTVRCELDVPPDVSPAGLPAFTSGRGRAMRVAEAEFQIAVSAASLRRTGGLCLVDDKGESIEHATVHAVMRRDARGLVREITVVAQPREGREAAKLVYTGCKMVSVEVPFTVKDVPLR